MTTYTITFVQSPNIAPEKRREILAQAFELLSIVGEQLAVTVSIGQDTADRESLDGDTPIQEVEQ